MIVSTSNLYCYTTLMYFIFYVYSSLITGECSIKYRIVSYRNWSVLFKYFNQISQSMFCGSEFSKYFGLGLRILKIISADSRIPYNGFVLGQFLTGFCDLTYFCNENVADQRICISVHCGFGFKLAIKLWIDGFVHPLFPHPIPSFLLKCK